MDLQKFAQLKFKIWFFFSMNGNGFKIMISDVQYDWFKVIFSF